MAAAAVACWPPGVRRRRGASPRFVPGLRRSARRSMSDADAGLPGMMRTAPEGWGDDTLSQFMTAGWRNAVDAFIEDPERYRPLAEVDAIYRRLIENLADNPEHLAGTLAVRSHASFLAGASLALERAGGRSVSADARLAAGGAVGHVRGGQSRPAELWAGRNDDDAARAARGWSSTTNGWWNTCSRSTPRRQRSRRSCGSGRWSTSRTRTHTRRCRSRTRGGEVRLHARSTSCAATRCSGTACGRRRRRDCALSVCTTCFPSGIGAWAWANV